MKQCGRQASKIKTLRFEMFLKWRHSAPIFHNVVNFIGRGLRGKFKAWFHVKKAVVFSFFGLNTFLDVIEIPKQQKPCWPYKIISLKLSLDSEINALFLSNEHSEPQFFSGICCKQSNKEHIWRKKAWLVEHEFFFENTSILGVFWPRRGLQANHGIVRKSAIFFTTRRSKPA